MIPKNPAWCSHCRCPNVYGRGSPCPEHRGPDGKPAAYAGLDAYEPSAEVLDIVGPRYRAPRWDKPQRPVAVYVCDGYDPRHGFWMRDTTDDYQTNISERAIGRTYHRVR